VNGMSSIAPRHPARLPSHRFVAEWAVEDRHSLRDGAVRSLVPDAALIGQYRQTM